MALIIGLYSKRPQSGKSTACAALTAQFSTEVIKISGAMKAMCAAAIAGLVPAQDMDAWVDGAYKDTPVPGLEPDCAQNPAIADALILAMGVPVTEGDLPLCDADGQPLTRGRIQADLILAWGQALALIFAATGALTPRDLQKTLGLEFGRALYGLDFWLRLIEARVQTSTADVIIVDDVRFPDDGGFVQSRGGLLVRIRRDDAQDIDSHPSEGLLEDWPFNVELDNNTTIAAYHDQIAERLVASISLHKAATAVA